MAHSLGELGRRFGLEVHGDAQLRIEGVCALEPGRAGCLSFLANPRYRSRLGNTRAAAVVLAPGQLEGYAGPALLAKDPYLAFARIAALFDESGRFVPGVHPSAVVDAGAQVAGSAWIGPGAVIETGAIIEEGVFIGPGCVIGSAARIGGGSRLEAQVWVGPRVRIGLRAHIQPGAVIGGRGFGLARGPQGWEEVPQLGGVWIGDDVEVGSNTTIDRGALEDTVIEDGVKLDNQIQIAHNVRIGAHTAIAACTGIAGSTRIGARCLIGGGVGIAGHLDIADEVQVLGFSLVSRSLSMAGAYSSGWPAVPVREWRRSVGRQRRMEKLEQRIQELERRLRIPSAASEPGESSDD